MAEPHDEHAERPEVAYETSDIGARGVVIFLATLAGIILAMSVVVGATLHYYIAYSGPSGNVENAPPGPELKPVSPWSVQRSGEMPVEPRLEGLRPRLEPRVLEQQQFERLHEYAWVDREKGIARIPVEQAIRALAGKLPAEKPEAPRVVLPPTESNSGRSFEIKQRGSES
jgi:hypothetical protein